jgi:UDP-N-acetylmuramoylalanine--D-glutamate ligase
MIESLPYDDVAVAVLGLGRSGTAAAEALGRSGARVWAWDDDERARARARQAGIPLVDLAQCDWRLPRVLLLSPGVPHDHPRPHPIVELARRAACEIVCDVELLARAQAQASFVGVTGTNGKSTTTALIAHIFAAAGHVLAVGGNLGTPALELAALERGAFYVLELSSYQLELISTITFDVAVLLNLSADHLDRHGGMDGYVAAKRRIFARQGDGAVAVVGVDGAHARLIHEELRAASPARAIPISAQGETANGVFADDGLLFDATEGEARAVLDFARAPSLPGRHNWQNAAAAWAAALAIGVEAGVIAAAIESFPGLPHRQERVALIDGVTFVNDSKATNADAAAKALACYASVYWIAGGRPKEGGLDPVLACLTAVRHAFLIGEAARDFAEALSGRVGVTPSGNLETAVGQAYRMAVAEGVSGAVVLLSPACASFDQFADFEDRGEAFRCAVSALERGVGAQSPTKRAERAS